MMTRKRHHKIWERSIAKLTLDHHRRNSPKLKFRSLPYKFIPQPECLCAKIAFGRMILTPYAYADSSQSYTVVFVLPLIYHGTIRPCRIYVGPHFCL